LLVATTVREKDKVQLTGHDCQSVPCDRWRCRRFADGRTCLSSFDALSPGLQLGVSTALVVQGDSVRERVVVPGAGNCSSLRGASTNGVVRTSHDAPQWLQQQQQQQQWQQKRR